MKNYRGGKWVWAAVFTSVVGATGVHAADPAPAIVGKNEWLFYRYELSDASDQAKTGESLSLIQRFNRVLSANGINMAVVMVPLKMRVYAEHLPDEVKIDGFLGSNYDRMRKGLQTAGVNVIDLNTAFLNSPKRSGESPLFFRLDTHWTPTGAMVAAETIKASIEVNAALKTALAATPEEGYKIVYGKRPRPSRGRDLVEQLPPNSPTFAPEQVIQVNVSRSQPPKEDLLGNRAPAGLTLVGSSYSSEWTGFSNALRYVLQRDVLGVSVGADQGSWVGMESYLRDDSFQAKAPKLLLWEMPERDMRAPPDYKFREARYVSNNTEWLLRASAWVQASCKPSSVTARLANLGLGANPVNVKGADVVTGPTGDNDFVEFVFDKPMGQLDYLAARTTTAGSKTVTLEGSGPGVTTRRFTIHVAGDDAAHAFRTPLPSNGNGFTKVRVFPGKSNGFSILGLQVCRQPEDLLQ
ncbi:MAG: hypothetical protein KJ614_16930 [Gammaproteobacteria bacterium]|uniref:alginate O-acetyltransferase AlgX-related protein n=1 Tax=Rhodoferax sp. TaxID=50421 RepID=UPI001813AD76|nr:hypothetical protein [Rhodoferax sp.]MBU3900580.1 hypothetical protein [Gammaproteobacteria bacterium]MBA3057515.1 hypothetical protein [Rhodoferax sp.]MBU3997350.1 hypothetical protein [Gammaproteobacteria bacterium]MBU4080025.1 hypothetical protein [Gammaproteobacteria bacterium]MBU4113481.1 hypothetical protein [Gammaproteobacteria bacterium]